MGDLARMRAAERLQMAIDQRRNEAHTETSHTDGDCQKCAAYQEIVQLLTSEFHRGARTSIEINEAAQRIATDPTAIEFPE